MTPKGLMTVAAAMGAASLLALGAGVVLLGAGAVASSAGSGTGAVSGGGVASLFRSGDSPANPGYEDGRPVGLYLMTRYWIATRSLEKAVWYFSKDGHVYFNPQDGFSEEKLSAHAERHGIAKADDKTMTITWSDGKETKSDLEHAEGGFNWDTGLFAPVEGFAHSKDLAGKWEGGTSVSFSGSNSAAVHGLELRPDGTFSGESIATFSSKSDGTEMRTGAQGSHSGQWKLDGYVLTFTYDDGKVVRGITFPFDDEKTPVYPDRFYFSGVMYKKL